jgi:RNA polymerase sigma-70 factor (ECF subfamily)
MQHVEPIASVRLDEGLSDEALVARVVGGETALFAEVVRRNNQRLYRVVRSITGDDTDAEDALQQTYIAAFDHLPEFEGRSRLSTWLTRIAINEAGARRRRRRRLRAVHEELETSAPSQPLPPDDAAMARQMTQRIEAALDDLPEVYRLVVVLREVHELSTAEVATSLNMTEGTVRVRLHRARQLLRAALGDEIEPRGAFAFAGRRCAGMLHRVMRELWAREYVAHVL